MRHDQGHREHHDIDRRLHHRPERRSGARPRRGRRAAPLLGLRWSVDVRRWHRRRTRRRGQGVSRRGDGPTRCRRRRSGHLRSRRSLGRRRTPGRSRSSSSPTTPTTQPQGRRLHVRERPRRRRSIARAIRPATRTCRSWAAPTSSARRSMRIWSTSSRSRSPRSPSVPASACSMASTKELDLEPIGVRQSRYATHISYRISAERSRSPSTTEATMTTMTEPTTRTLEVPGAVLTYDIRRAGSTPSPVLLLIGSPMGASGFVHPGRPLRRPHRRHLRPARRRAQHEGRPVQPVDARPARRRPPSDHRRARRRSGRPVRQQRRRGQRPRPRGPHPEQVRTLVAHEPPLAAILPDRDGAHGAHPGHPRRRTSAAASEPAWPGSSSCVGHHGPDRPRLPRAAGARSGDVRAADRGRRQPHRPAAGTEHAPPARTSSPTSTRCGRLRPGSSSAPVPSRRDRWRIAARSPSPSDSARHR